MRSVLLLTAVVTASAVTATAVARIQHERTQRAAVEAFERYATRTELS